MRVRRPAIDATEQTSEPIALGAFAETECRTHCKLVSIPEFSQYWKDQGELVRSKIVHNLALRESAFLSVLSSQLGLCHGYAPTVLFSGLLTKDVDGLYRYGWLTG